MRAAASLSELTGHRVLLEVPQVSVHPIAELNRTLRLYLEDQVASVHQIFSGPVGGDALLILNYSAAGMLKELDRLLPGDAPLVDRYDAFRQKFIIPSNRLARVFDRAIAECCRIIRSDPVESDAIGQFTARNDQ